jgi:3-deoxy-manno-octulosonate cytidylyltransferase (CMP-KDO synthetase)
MNIATIIPSRYSSTRLTGKPLIDIAGKPMIQWVYESAGRAQSVGQIVVATDDSRIVDAVTGFGGNAELTSPHHVSGTDRVAEVAARIPCDIVVNLQGDEPLMAPQLIDAVVNTVIRDRNVYMASAYVPITSREEMMSPNVVKVVTNDDGYALYFSRSPIPYCSEKENSLPGPLGFKHIGLYVYRKEFLMKFVALDPSPLEKREKLEQLRALENGYAIKLVSTDYDSIGVDVAEDLEKVVRRLKTGNH